MEAEVGEEGIVMREEAGESRAMKQAGSAGDCETVWGKGRMLAHSRTTASSRTWLKEGRCSHATERSLVKERERWDAFGSALCCENAVPPPSISLSAREGRESESSPSCSPYRDTGDSPVELDLDDDVELGISATTSC